MEFRPCIDIHNGKVKQIIGGTLKDQGDRAVENFVAREDGAYYAELYRQRKLQNGHVILLNAVDSPYYEATKKQAFLALSAYPGGLQVGGGMNESNAAEFLEAGASHVIVTSYVFRDGMIHEKNLQRIQRETGKDRLVLDLSCRKKDHAYYIVTDRWQKFTRERVTPELLCQLAGECDEFLIHAVDVEGKANGIETELVEMLGGFDRIPVTYAGGIGDYEDILKLKREGKGRVNATIGSALDLFGGKLQFDKVLDLIYDDKR